MGIGDKFDDIKGKIKEEVGDLTNNEKLEREGQADQVEAQAKDKVDSAGDKLKDGIDKVRDN